jgi:copper/silver efflux system protein
MSDLPQVNLLDRVIRFCLNKKLIVGLLLIGVIATGLAVVPFSWDGGGLPRMPVPVDAIPDIGENQQIVFTQWTGRSPQDVEDQITYPLTVALMGVPGVKTVRSYSYFGFSTIYIIFAEGVEFYWSRSRVLEKLNSLSPGTVPAEVKPTLGPDATALGQVYWYTLEGRDPNGQPTGGWSLEELRSVQDWYVRYALQAAEGVSEVASVGGFVEEYQIDVDPDAMRAFGVSLNQIFEATRMSNLDVGARTIEVNGAEYVIRGLGFIKDIADIEEIAVSVSDNVPVRMRDVAHISKGPALRRGVLDKSGAEAVGGVVVVRYGSNPMAVIASVKEKIAELSPGLPSKVVIDYRQVSREALTQFAVGEGFQAYVDNTPNQEAWTQWLRLHPFDEWPAGVTLSQLEIVPFYDRTALIKETLGTLNQALTDEIYITIIVVLIMVLHLRSSLLISALLPVAVLMCFIAMKLFDVPANIVALSGIAIAIGTMVDMGVIVSENILRHMDEAADGESTGEIVFRATREVSGAVLTSVATTIVSFLPVFTMTGAEGKLFAPLAFTKTFALLAAVIIALTIIPPAAHILFGTRLDLGRYRKMLSFRLPDWLGRASPVVLSVCAALGVSVLLAQSWMPLGVGRALLINLLFVVLLVGGLLWAFTAYQRVYPQLLALCLRHKSAFMLLPGLLLSFGLVAWSGFDNLFRFAPDGLRQSSAWLAVHEVFPGFGSEFMPDLDEGSFLYMPTTMPHASIGEAHSVLKTLDQAIAGVPEVASVVGKLGRAESPLDPAPISMFETIVNYKSEYVTDEDGRVRRFAVNAENGEFLRDENNQLEEDSSGRPFRQWRSHISSPDDIWREIVAAADLPGTTSAPKLQPIAARLVMLQSGMRAPMGIKIKGPSLDEIEATALQFEKLLKLVPGVQSDTVIADRLVGKPYLEIKIDRAALARYGLRVGDVQLVIEVALGGKQVTSTIEGRERYPVRVRYFRELRDTPEGLEKILVATPAGAQIPLGQLAEIQYVRGPQAIKSEDTFLVGYVVFDKRENVAEVDVVEEAKAFLQQQIDDGTLIIPARVSYTFTGNYENQLHAQQTLKIVVPAALVIIFLILYLQFASVSISLIVFSGIAVAWAGGFLLIWLYSLPAFLDFTVLGTNMQSLFQVDTINMSVAVWVGFLALFGIATDNGVVTATYLQQSMHKQTPKSKADIRALVVTGAQRRIRPALMTTATTLIALLPILTSTGRGSDIMMPMAIPSFGGMLVAVVTTLLVPVLYCAIRERSFVATTP